MSKIKKKPVQSPASISEDVKLIKMIQIAGWFFILALLTYFAVWVVFDFILDVEFIDIHMDAVTYSFIIFTGSSSALCFALASKIKNNTERKREFFIDWLIGELLFAMFAIFSVAIYLW